LKLINRNQYFDVIKGIAIILVILGHCIQFGSGEKYFLNEQYFGNPVFIFIDSLHMPLFMIISGILFFYMINKYSTEEMLKSCFTKNLLPIFVWTTLINIGLLIIKIVFGISLDLTSFMTSLLNQYLNTLWYLWAIFIAL
jgi:fucose 4-O-acetylase-like acetyltransferase